MKIIFSVGVLFWALSTTPMLVFLLSRDGMTRVKELSSIALFLIYAEGCLLAGLALELME